MKQEIIQRLHELAESITERHGWAVLKSHIEEIDAAIGSGVKTKAIEEALAELGLDLAPTVLRSALYRYRKKRKSNKLASSIRVATTPTAPKRPPNEEVSEPQKEGETASPSGNPWAYKSQLTPEEKEYLSTLSPAEKVAYYRQESQRRKFTHNPTPEWFRKDGE